MSRPWYGTAYLRWIQPLHERGMIPFCFDCRLLRQARETGEFYTHDEPLWHVEELFQTGEPCRIYRTCVDIDLNVRVRGNETFVGTEDVHGVCEVGEEVMVRETESGITGSGRITDVDHERRIVFLAVDWSDLTLPPMVGTHATGTGQTWTWDQQYGLRRLS